MGKRFTETNKWKNPWFRKLSAENKCFWQFLLDECDNVGVWKEDWETASYFLGFKISKMPTQFDGRIANIEDGKWLILTFMRFQWGEKIVQPTSRIYKNLSGILLKHEMDRLISDRGIDTLCLPYQYPTDTAKDKDKEQDKEQVKDKDQDKDKDLPF